MAFIVSAASGCATAGKATNWLTGKSPPENEEHVVLGAPSADEYLRELNDLVAGDPDKQADIFADASSAARLTPGPSTDLRLGLVLATPGHPASDPVQAQRLLSGVLEQSELMTAAEISLARIALNSVDSVIVTNTQATRLQESTSRTARSEEQAISQRLATAEAENARLRVLFPSAELVSLRRGVRQTAGWLRDRSSACG